MLSSVVFPFVHSNDGLPAKTTVLYTLFKSLVPSPLDEKRTFIMFLSCLLTESEYNHVQYQMELAHMYLANSAYHLRFYFMFVSCSITQNQVCIRVCVVLMVVKLAGQPSQISKLILSPLVWNSFTVSRTQGIINFPSTDSKQVKKGWYNNVITAS